MPGDPCVSSNAITVGILRVDLDGQSEVVDRLVPFILSKPELRPADMTRRVIRLEFDDLVPVVDGEVILLAVVWIAALNA